MCMGVGAASLIACSLVTATGHSASAIQSLHRQDEPWERLLWGESDGSSPRLPWSLGFLQG